MAKIFFDFLIELDQPNLYQEKYLSSVPPPVINYERSLTRIPGNPSKTSKFPSLVVLLFLHHRMANQRELERRLFLVIICRMNEDLPCNALQDLEVFLIQRLRDDLLDIFYQTMAGKIIVKPKRTI